MDFDSNLCLAIVSCTPLRVISVSGLGLRLSQELLAEGASVEYSINVNREPGLSIDFP